MKSFVIIMIIKSLSRSKLSWVRIVKNIFTIATREQEVIASTINNFWMQHYINQWDFVFESFHYFHLQWRRMKNDLIDIKLFTFTSQLIKIYFWYHSKLERSDKRNAKKFNSTIWRHIWNVDARKLNDIWNSINNASKILSNIVSNSFVIKIVIRRLILNVLSRD